VRGDNPQKARDFDRGELLVRRELPEVSALPKPPVTVS
jgi:hypothetical protein